MERRGRPRKDGAKRTVIGLRMDNNEVNKLDEVCQRTKLSRTDLIRNAIDMYYSQNISNK